MKNQYLLTFLLVISTWTIILSKKSKSQIQQRTKQQHRKQFLLGAGGYIASDESNQKSPVDHEPWHYKLMPPDVMRKPLAISKDFPLDYNQQEDKENKKGCKKADLFELEEEQPKEKPRIYNKDTNPYYDPTEELRIESYHKDVLAVPVVMERDLVTDQKALENQRKQLYSNNKYYYDPSVLDHLYDVDQKNTIMHTATNPLIGTIHTDRKTIPYDELFQRSFVDDIVKHQFKMPHKQDIPIKQMQAVYQRIRQQKNKLVSDKLKDEVLPPLNKNQKRKKMF